MTFLFNVFAFLHFLGWAIVLGGYLAYVRKPGLPKGVFHGAATALVAGVVMLGMLEGGAVGDGLDASHRIKLTVKLAVALVITVLAFIAQRKGDELSPALKHTIGGLTVANIAVAVFW